MAQPATYALPFSIGRNNCGSTSSSTIRYSFPGVSARSYDSLYFFNYVSPNLTASTIRSAYVPRLRIGSGTYTSSSPSMTARDRFAISAASVSFNPKDGKLYYLWTDYSAAISPTLKTYVWRWNPDTTFSTASYNNPLASILVDTLASFAFDIGGITFDNYGNAWQLEFSNAPAPYKSRMRKIDFVTKVIDPIPDTLDLIPTVGIGSTIYSVSSGDITLMPNGQMYYVFDNKLYTPDYGSYGNPTHHISSTYIDTIRRPTGATNLVGLAYGNGDLISSFSPGCIYRRIDPVTGDTNFVNYTYASAKGVASSDMSQISSGLGVAKKLVSVTSTGTAGQYNVVYDVFIKNYGTTRLTNLQVFDSLNYINGAANLSNVSTTMLTIPPPPGIALNPAFNGVTDARLLQTTGQNLPNYPVDSSSFTVRINCRISNVLDGVVYNNNAIGYATGYKGVALRDSSTNGNVPDLNQNDKPDDVGEGQPTPFVIILTPTTPPCATLSQVLYTNTFGTGVGLSASLPASPSMSTQYTGTATAPVGTNRFSTTNNAALGDAANWISLTDHTGDVDGRMMVVNADGPSYVFYRDTLPVACPGQQYSMSFWTAFIGNATYQTTCNALGGFKYPKFLIRMRDLITGLTITQFTTANITLTSWQQLGMKWVMPAGYTNIIMELLNAGPGGCGNDFALDDVQYGICDPAPTVSAASSCFGGSATFTSALGDPTVIPGSKSYQWQVAPALAGPYVNITGATSSTYTINPILASDTGKFYRVIIAAAGNMAIPACQYTSPGVKLTSAISSVAPSSISAPSTTFCNPGSATLTAVGGTLGTSANYQWGTGAVVGTGPIVGATNSTLTVSPTVTTTYWVRIENTAGPCTSITGGTAVTVTVIQPSAEPSSITGPDICNGSPTTLTAVGGTLGTGANYQWGTGAVVGTSPIAGATNPTLTVSPSGTTTYWVSIQNTTAPCTATTGGVTKVVTVTQPSAAPSSISAPSTTICNGNSVLLTSVGGTLGTGANYQWGTGAVVGTSPIGGATSSSLNVSPTTTTTYWVRIENTASPCTAATGGTTVTITVNQPSAAPGSVTGPDVCNGGSTTLTAVGGTLGTSANYQWGTGAVVGTSPIGGATSSTLTVSPTTTTTYWVRVENTAGPCTPTTSGVTKVVTVAQPSAAPSSITGPDICNGSSTTLTANGGTLGTSANYQWGTGAVVGTSPIGGATSSTLTVSPSSTTTYWVRIENTAGPCTATTSGVTKLVTVSQLSVAATAAGRNKNNICPGISAKIYRTGGTLGTAAIWRWYTGSPGGTLIGSGDTLTVTPAVNTTYYLRAEGTCNTTPAEAVTINISCDIDKDRDGIPDYIESNIAAAVANGYNTGYAGYIDYNNDFINDNFQADGDSDNDGIPNYLDATYPGRVDSNSDGIDDRFDIDLDGVINMLDLDSDNDGITDVAEAYGVDTNGDGRLDNFTDTDGDGLSQNIDPNNTGANNSGIGLGLPNLDSDVVANFLDLDSDNDGIPDIVEVGGPDTNNDGKADSFVDANGDGLHDSYINGTALLLTGTDGNADGRADTWPNKNLDRDLRPNAYDMDSDGDGIVDVIESGLPDVDFNGIVDGVIGANGWSTTVSVMPALNLRNTDAFGNHDYLDIDSDEDGIPDNIEGMSTASYALPTLVDADGDGLMNPYDNTPAAFGGSGILVYDHDADGTPDYRDLDSDADALSDRVEGNDYNLNGLPDDLVTPTGIDTDGDGLDNRYDSLNSVTNIKGTSYRMGAGGSFTGDAAPGSRTTVQRTLIPQTDRDWRFVGFVLPVQFVKLAGLLQTNKVLLSWTVIASKEVDHFEVERSTDNRNFIHTGTVIQTVKLNEQQSFSFVDDITNVNKEVIYYRIKVIGKTGEIQYSNILIIRRQQTKTGLTIMPNPAKDYVSIAFFAQKESEVSIRLIDHAGKLVLLQNQKVSKGSNTLQLTGLSKYSNGTYALQLFVNDDVVSQKLVLLK